MNFTCDFLTGYLVGSMAQTPHYAIDCSPTTTGEYILMGGMLLVPIIVVVIIGYFMSKD